ncbi:MAG: hypothetical protein L6R39_000240 [Caloplaca ligustica]|nr:MAG: hypothetical protein L6R39_000240 [Caloplaca ligustica]
MEPENAEEEFPEGVEHLDEEIPPESYIWSQVRKQEMYPSQAKDPKKKADNLKAMFDFDPADWSWHKRIMGGSKRAGYREM